MPSPHDGAPLLQVERLSVDYGAGSSRTRAVDDVSLSIARGEVLGLAGESGSGKSTLAYALLRLLRPPAVISAGRVLVEGRDVLAMNETELRALRWRSVSLVFQSAMNALNPVMRIGEQIADAIRAHRRVSMEEALERAATLIELVGIDRARLGSYPHQLSGGMRQRAVIAIALALEPPLIIMDEPTTALDVVVQKEILAQITELKDELGLSILFITHDLSLLIELSDRIGILYAGKLVETGPSRELLDGARHPYTRGLLESFPSVRGPRRRLQGIGGAPPDLRAPPAGCRFHPRCAEADARCASEAPRLLRLGEFHEAACHRLDAAAARPLDPRRERASAAMGAMGATNAMSALGAAQEGSLA